MMTTAVACTVAAVGGVPPRSDLGTLDRAMSEAHAIKPEPLTEVLTWKQICERYPDQWVALVEMDWDDETDEFTVARVAGRISAKTFVLSVELWGIEPQTSRVRFDR